MELSFSLGVMQAEARMISSQRHCMLLDVIVEH
jgi:hypothetical protein